MVILRLDEGCASDNKKRRNAAGHMQPPSGQLSIFSRASYQSEMRLMHVSVVQKWNYVEYCASFLQYFISVIKKQAKSPSDF